MFWKHLLEATFHDDLPEVIRPEGDSTWVEVVRRLSNQPNSAWWDDRTTFQEEGRDEIFRRALREAVDELERLQGREPTRWKWGLLHTVTFRSSSLGRSGVRVMEAIFNRGPFPVSGGASIVNATAWDAASADFSVVSLPSMRMIVDLGNLDHSLSILTTGQSGHVYHPHNTDMVELWRTIQYHPMLWERERVLEEAERAIQDASSFVDHIKSLLS